MLALKYFVQDVIELLVVVVVLDCVDDDDGDVKVVELLVVLVDLHAWLYTQH